MAGDLPEGLRARLHVLAIDFLLKHRPVVPGAVDLACDLIVAGRDGPATVEVAALFRDARIDDAEHLLRSMLLEQGVEVPLLDTAEQRFAAMRTAFGFWDLPIAEFEGPFYERLPAWDDQEQLDRRLVVMLDRRDNEVDPERRRDIEDQMRVAIREAESSGSR